MKKAEKFYLLYQKTVVLLVASALVVDALLLKCNEKLMQTLVPFNFQIEALAGISVVILLAFSIVMTFLQLPKKGSPKVYLTGIAIALVAYIALNLFNVNCFSVEQWPQL